MRLILFVADLFVILPWWGAVGVLAGMVLGLYLLGQYLVHRMFRDVVASVLEQGTPLKNAEARIHSVRPAAAPTEPSAFDLDPDDEDYDPELDGNWEDDETEFFWIEATITPKDADATWIPGDLSLVSADFEPQEELEMCEQTAVLHTVEIFRDGEFERSANEPVTGPQRVRLLFAATEGLHEARFAYHFTYFGQVSLPTTVAR